jgi:hypothetical protein
MATAYNPKIVTDGLAALVDFANPKSFSPNTFPEGLDIYSWYVPKRGNTTGNGCTVEQDLVTPRSPVGGIPMKMNVTGNDPHIGSYNTATWNISTAANLQTWRVSVYAKASTTLTNCEIYIFGANSSGVSFVDGSYIGITNKTITVTTEWQRFDHLITFNNASVAFIQMRLDGPNSGGAGTTVWWDGLQVEPVAVTRFNPRGNQNYSNTFDLVDNSSDTIFSYPVYDSSGFLTFDGTNNYADLSVGTLGSVITVEMLVKMKSLSNVMPFGFTAYDVYTFSGQLGFNTAASDRYGLTSTQTTDLGILNNWRHFCFVMFNDVSLGSLPYTNNKIYVNGISYPLSQTAGTQSGTPRSFTNGLVRLSGWRSDSQYKMPMDLAIFKIYNKQLTDAEIQQNFAASRGRYGV